MALKCIWKEVKRFDLNFASTKDRTCPWAKVEKKKLRISHTSEIGITLSYSLISNLERLN